MPYLNSQFVRVCPGCGGVEIETSRNDDPVCHAWAHPLHEVGHWIFCDTCDYDGPNASTFDNAVIAWNKL